MNQRLTVYLLLYGALVASPVLVFAATATQVLDDIVTLVGLFIPLLFGLALLFFLWGLAKFILNAGNETARTEARSIMIWGIIALFVMVSVWGLVKVLDATFGLESDAAPTFPEPLR